jgi:hypothetical protein
MCRKRQRLNGDFGEVGFLIEKPHCALGVLCELGENALLMIH